MWRLYARTETVVRRDNAVALPELALHVCSTPSEELRNARHRSYSSRDHYCCYGASLQTLPAVPRHYTHRARMRLSALFLLPLPQLLLQILPFLLHLLLCLSRLLHLLSPLPRHPRRDARDLEATASPRPSKPWTAVRSSGMTPGHIPGVAVGPNGLGRVNSHRRFLLADSPYPLLA